jgi:hypothetical protein
MAERLPEGEQAVLSALEDKARLTSPGQQQQQQQRPAVYDALGESASAPPAGEKRKPSLARLVRKVMTEQRNMGAPAAGGQPGLAGLVRKVMTEQKNTVPAARGHSRSRSNAQVYNLLKNMKDAPSGSLNDIFQEDVFYPEGEGVSSTQVATDDASEPETTVPDGTADADVDIEQTPVVVDSTTPLLPQTQTNTLAVQRLKMRGRSGSLCSGTAIRSFFRGLLAHCWLMIFSAILAGVALVLYYELGNPKVDALGRAGLSWYCNFFARQLVLLECARVIKFLFLDCILLGSHSVKYVGPVFTLLALQAKDWPFIVAVWGVLDCCLLQGNNAFQNHWLYQTGWDVYSMKAASGLTLLTSESYLRFLVCMIVAGTATVIKRTLMAISFGQRQYGTFKPRLEKLLLDVVLLNEVASLSAQASLMHAEMNPMEEKTSRKKKKGLQDVTWSSVRVESALDESEEHDADESTNEGLSGRHAFQRANSSQSFLKSLLDRWEEPVTITKVGRSLKIEDCVFFGLIKFDIFLALVFFPGRRHHRRRTTLSPRSCLYG